MLKIENLNKRFGKKNILEDINLELENKTYGLLGANGAGKTTLLRAIAGVYKIDNKYFPRINGIKVGYLPQKFGLFPEFTVYDHLEYFCNLKKLPRESYEHEIERVMELTNIKTIEKLKCKKLSGGMCRRVGIAQAILGMPDLLLLDEPTVGLDLAERDNFVKTISISLAEYLLFLLKSKYIGRKF